MAERPAKWAGSATTSDFSSRHGLVFSLSREVTQPSMIIDGGLTAFQMWGQMPTSWCSSPIMTGWYVFLFSLSLALLSPHCFRRPRVLWCRESGRLCDSRLHSHGAFWDPHLTKSSLTLVISQVQVPASFLLQIYFSCFFLGFREKMGDIRCMAPMGDVHMPRGGVWIYFSNWISWPIWPEEARAQRMMQTGCQPTNSLSILISTADGCHIVWVPSGTTPQLMAIPEDPCLFDTFLLNLKVWPLTPLENVFHGHRWINGC